jgi:CubicO group peptidase (beta-lactamase class C family)
MTTAPEAALLEVEPRRSGMDAGRLERIGEHLERSYIEPGKLAGCQVMVARRGQVTYFRSFGGLELERTRPVVPDTIWRIYSMTKPITSVALMTLYERGRFQLLDPVHRFLPAWRGLKVCEPTEDGGCRLVEAARPVTFRDLLTHTAGLTYARNPDEPVARLYLEAGLLRRDFPLQEFAVRLAEIPLVFHPGRHWHYSVATDVCGHLVELLSGRRFDDYLREEIFEPLGMVDSGFYVPEAKWDRLAANYQRLPDKTLGVPERRYARDYSQLPRFLSGGGGLVSTTGDYLRFCRMLLNGGELDGARVLGPKTVELMRQNHLPGGCDIRTIALGDFGETGFDGVGFGLGFAVGLGPARSGVVGSPGEYYWGGAASTIFWIDPVEDLVVLFMTQLMPSGTFNFRGQLHALVYAAIVDSGSAAPDR